MLALKGQMGEIAQKHWIVSSKELQSQKERLGGMAGSTSRLLGDQNKTGKQAPSSLEFSIDNEEVLFALPGD